MALDTFDFKPEAKLQDFQNVANLSSHISNPGRPEGVQGDKNAYAMPKEFTAGGNDLTIVDDSLAKSMKTAESMLSPEAKARVEKEAAVPYNAIKAAGEYHEPDAIRAQHGDSYWGVAQMVLASRGHGHAGNKEIQAMVSDLAQANGKTLDQANHLKAGDIIKLPHAK